MKRVSLAAALLCLWVGGVSAQGRRPAQTPAAPLPKAAEPVPFPVWVSAIPNINDYGYFANGGWNANWYVGYDTCWVHRLPAAPAGDFVAAYLGVKLGAMKTEPIPGRPTWERRPVPGRIDVALGPAPVWSQSQRYLLTRTEDIPLAGDPHNALKGVGEARWFWIEVPLSAVSFDGPNFVALFSPDEALRDATRSPILAAGPSNGVVDTWLNNTVSGQPPLVASEALKTPVVSYEPAIVLKLIPRVVEPPRVRWLDKPEGGMTLSGPITLGVRVEGPAVRAVRLEYSVDGRSWKGLGEPLEAPPHVFTLDPRDLPPGQAQVRVAARNVWEALGATPPVSVKRAR